ncbi:hypothetical protein SISNIDRAFT_537238, partial [Sistotremastrum niveocremeum HHB9708]
GVFSQNARISDYCFPRDLHVPWLHSGRIGGGMFCLSELRCTALCQPVSSAYTRCSKNGEIRGACLCSAETISSASACSQCLSHARDRAREEREDAAFRALVERWKSGQSAHR